MHAIFVHKNRTADYQITCRLAQIMANDGNADDITAFLLDRNLPIGEIEAQGLAEEILRNPPQLGCLAISNAMQWRLHYSRAIAQAGAVAGIGRMR